jgi:hypothetical protein
MSDEVKPFYRTKQETARIFALHYAEHQNERSAAIAIGVDPSRATQRGHALAKSKMVLGELKRIGARTHSQKIKTIEQLQERLSEIIDGNTANLPEHIFINPETERRYSDLECDGIRWKYQCELKHQLKAIELLGKSLGMYIEKEVERESKQIIERIIERRIVHVAADADGNVTNNVVTRRIIHDSTAEKVSDDTNE